MNYLPIFLAIEGEPCLLVGGSQAAEPKARLLLRAGARLTVIATDLTPGLRTFAGEDGVTWRRRAFRDDDMDGMRLAVVATDDDVLAHAVADAARRRGIRSTPSIGSRCARSSCLRSSTARRWSRPFRRAAPRPCLPVSCARASKPSSRRRSGGSPGSSARSGPPCSGRISDPVRRRRFFEDVVDGPIGEQVLAGREDGARRALESALTERERTGAAGEVYLVGAGPGDPDLLTFRALRLMQKADVAVYDRLVSNAVLDLVRRDAERIYAGKQPGDHAIPQPAINDLLARLAPRRQAGAAAEGRRPVHLRARRRGDRKRSPRMESRSRSSPESPRPRDARPTRGSL